MRKALAATLTICLLVSGVEAWAGPLGSILVADSTNLLGNEIGPTGGIIQTFAEPDNGGFYSGGVAVAGPDDSIVYFGDTAGRVLEFNRATGVMQNVYTRGWVGSVTDVEVNPANGFLYMIDPTPHASGNGAIGWLDPGLDRLRPFDTETAIKPFAMAFTDGGAMYVTDQLPGGGGRLVSYPERALEDALSATPITIEGVLRPRGIAVLPNGNVLVADYAAGAGVAELEIDHETNTGTVVNTITMVHDSLTGNDYYLERAYALDIVGNYLLIGDFQILDGEGAIVVYDLSNPMNSWIVSGEAAASATSLEGIEDMNGSQIPEPATMVMVGCGLVALACRRRRR